MLRVFKIRRLGYTVLTHLLRKTYGVWSRNPVKRTSARPRPGARGVNEREWTGKSLVAGWGRGGEEQRPLEQSRTLPRQNDALASDLADHVVVGIGQIDGDVVAGPL